MELNEFVKNVLIEINQGIQMAQSKNNEHSIVIVKDNTEIEFDLAITNNTKSEAKNQINVILNSVEKDPLKKNVRSSLNRVKFVVHLQLTQNQK